MTNPQSPGPDDKPKAPPPVLPPDHPSNPPDRDRPVPIQDPRPQPAPRRTGRGR